MHVDRQIDDGSEDVLQTSWRQLPHDCATHRRGRSEKLKASYRHEQPRGFSLRATSTCVVAIFENVGMLHKNEVFKRVLRKLRHNCSACVHLNFTSKYKEDAIPNVDLVGFGGVWRVGHGGLGVRRTQSEK